LRPIGEGENETLRKLPKIFQNEREEKGSFLRREIDYTVCAISNEGDSVTNQLCQGEQFRIDDLPFSPYKVMVVASIRDVHNPGQEGMYIIPSTIVTVYEG